jgi:hypothetical protein
MNARNSISILLAATVGFLLGAMFVRQTPVKAQTGLQVYVEHHEATIMAIGSTNIPAREIVGFSCVPDHNFIECYTAYVK